MLFKYPCTKRSWWLLSYFVDRETEVTVAGVLRAQASPPFCRWKTKLVIPVSKANKNKGIMPTRAPLESSRLSKSHMIIMMQKSRHCIFLGIISQKDCQSLSLYLNGYLLIGLLCHSPWITDAVSSRQEKGWLPWSVGALLCPLSGTGYHHAFFPPSAVIQKGWKDAILRLYMRPVLGHRASWKFMVSSAQMQIPVCYSHIAGVPWASGSNREC